MSAATKPALGECPLTASHTRRACDNSGACWCIEHPEEVAAINNHPEVIEARSAAYNFNLGGDSAARAWRTLGPKMSATIDEAYEALLWISEYPNRQSYPVGSAVDLAEFARKALNKIDGTDRYA